MNEWLNFGDQENANQISANSNETQLNHGKSMKEKRPSKLESWLIFG